MPALPEAELLAENFVDQLLAEPLEDPLEEAVRTPIQPVAAAPRLGEEAPVTPVTPAADLQFILMQQMQQQLFQMQQQMMGLQLPAPPPNSLVGRSGASRSIIFTSTPSASPSAPRSGSEEGEELKRMEQEGDGELII